MRFRLLTVVWGEAFVDRLHAFALRTLVAPGNLPSVARKHQVAYSIYTTARDAPRLRTHPAFESVAACVDVQVHTFSLAEINPSDAYSHWLIWRKGVSAARGNGELVITVAPDHVFAGNAISHWVELFEKGTLATFSPGIQVVLETMHEELMARFSVNEVVDLSREELIHLMFRHLHPVNITMFRDSPRSMPHPEYHLRAIPGHGFVQRILTSHAVAFDPSRIKMTDDLRPVEKLDRVAFEPSWFLSAEPLLKNLASYYYPWRIDDERLGRFGKWGKLYFAPSNIAEAKQPHSYFLVYRFNKTLTFHVI